MIDWFWGFDPSLNMQFGSGVELNFRIGFSKKNRKIDFMIIPVVVIEMLILAFLLIIFINVLIYKRIVFTVRKKFINPYLFSRKLSLQNTKFVGLFNQGDFGNGRFVIKPTPEIGKINNDIFFYIYAIDDDGAKHQYTIKVSTMFLFIRKVILKSKEENIEIELTRSR